MPYCCEYYNRAFVFIITPTGHIQAGQPKLSLLRGLAIRDVSIAISNCTIRIHPRSHHPLASIWRQLGVTG